MTTLRHPNVEGMTIDVPDEKAEDYKQQGWKPEPKSKSTTKEGSANA